MQLELTPSDINRIFELNSKITTVPAHIVAWTNWDVMKVLEHGHPMNRIIRDPETKEIQAYLWTEDYYDQSAENNNTEKQLYIKYLCSDGNISALHLEIKKFIKRAKKKKYKKILFDGYNERLNNILVKYFGFQKMSNNTSALDKRFFLDISSTFEKAIKYLETDNNASQVWNSLDTQEQEHIRWLLQKTSQQGQDLQVHNLYGALDILKNNNVDLQSLNSLKKLYNKSQYFNALSQQRSTSQEYAQDLLLYLQDHNPSSSLDIEQYQDLIELIFSHINKPWLDSKIKEYLDQNEIIYPKDVVFTKTFLSGLDTRTPFKKLASLDHPDYPYDLVLLLTKQELKKETDYLGHCVWDSDFYMEKIKNKQILVISLRDSDGVAHWTLEYNIKNKSIVQFKWWGDVPVNSLPDSRDLVFSCLEAFQKSWLEVEAIAEEFEYSIIQDGKTGKCESADLQLWLREVCLDKSKKILKWELELDATYSEQELDRLCNIPWLTLDTTKLPQNLKDTITHVAGNIKDSWTDVSFEQLKKNGWYFNAWSAKNISLPAFESNGWDFYAWDAKNISLPAFKNNGWNFHASSAQNISLPAFESNGWDFYAWRAQNISLPAFESNGWGFYAWSAKNISLPVFENNGWDFYASSAQNISLPVFENNGWYFYARDPEYVFAPMWDKVDWESVREYNERIYKIIEKTLREYPDGIEELLNEEVI